MQTKIKVHSSLKHLFSSTEFSADLIHYADIYAYLRSMQPRFFNYLKIQYSIGIEESYVILDKAFKVLYYEDLQIKRAKKDDILYIVPAIVGGGGKRGGILAALAFFALAAVTGGSSLIWGAGAAGNITIAGSAPLASLVTRLATNIGLAFLQSAFSSKKSMTDKETRNNDAFGSLVNTSSSNTPIALHYGQVRVAGQFISGYISSASHGKSDVISVASYFDD